MTTTMVIMTMMRTWQWRKELVVGQEPLHSPFTITLRTLAALIKKLPGQKCFSEFDQVFFGPSVCLPVFVYSLLLFMYA